MKTLFKALLLIILLFSFLQINAQDKIAIDDQSNLVTSQIDLLLVEKFKSQQLEYNNMVDYKERCKYYFTEILEDQGEMWVVVNNCENQLVGEKKLSAGIGQMNDNDKAGMLVYVIMDIINNPLEAKAEVDRPEDKTPEKGEDIPAYSGLNEHDSRHFFSPTSYNLKKGELYYNTLYFVMHDVQYGISDNFSLGMGTTIAAIPFYITPKLSIKLGDLHKMAIGDMLIIGTWGTDLLGNLAYATYTYGTKQSNFTIGGGVFSINQSNAVGKENTNAPVLNFGGMVQISDYLYFIGENYFSSFDDYGGKTNISMGIFGIRFINKKVDVRSWQAGLAYFKPSGDTPIAIPMIGFTHKFGKKY